MHEAWEVFRSPEPPPPLDEGNAGPRECDDLVFLVHTHFSDGAYLVPVSKTDEDDSLGLTSSDTYLCTIQPTGDVRKSWLTGFPSCFFLGRQNVGMSIRKCICLLTLI